MIIKPYLFHIEKFITQFKTTEKNYKSPHFVFEEMTIYLYGEVQPQRKSLNFLMRARWLHVKLCAVGVRSAMLGNASSPT